jgi:glycosyltransferase involved in cell wall biosynthesis
MLSDVYFPRVNGVSTSIQTFRRCLVSAGHRVTLVAPAYGAGAEEEIDTLRVKSWSVPMDPEDRLMRWGALMRACADLRAEDFDLIHIQTPFLAHYAGVRLARRLRLPVVATYHTFFEEYFHHYVHFLPASATRFMARRFSAAQCNALDALIAPSQPMLQALRGYGVTTPAKVIPTGIDLSRFAAGDGMRFRKAQGIEPQRPVVLYVGRVVFEKNIDFLLDVVAVMRREIPRILFIIAGEGPARESLRAQALRLGLADNTLFVGYLNREGPLMDCYSAADAFIFASRTETQGLVLLEALALGVPVVSTAVMGTAEIVEPQRGCLVASEQAAEFAAQTARLLSDAALRAKLSREGREYAQSWSEQRFAASMVEFYRSVVAHHKTPQTQ